MENFRSRMAIGSTFVKNTSCLNPRSLEKLRVKVVVKRFAMIVHSLTKQNMCSNSEGDSSIGQFKTLVNCLMNGAMEVMIESSKRTVVLTCIKIRLKTLHNFKSLVMYF